MVKIAASFALFSYVSLPVSVSASFDSPDVGDDQAACEMQTTLLQTQTQMLDAKRLHIDGKAKTSLVMTALANAKAATVQRSSGAKVELQPRQEACPIADETEENTVVASLVPNNGLVCYGGSKRELDQAYCLLQTAPTRALYRAGDSPWFQGDDVPADVEVQLESCESRSYEFLLHDPDDCWAPVQKWIRAGEQGDEDFDGWEIAQMENWQNYDALHGVSMEHGDLNTGIFLSGCICLEGTDVMVAMEEICVDVHHGVFLPIDPPLPLQTQGHQDEEIHEDEEHLEDEEHHEDETVQVQGPALPIRLFHAPKCGGTSFFNALFALPGVCNGDEPPVYSGQLGDDPFELEHILDDCPGFHYGIPAHPCLHPQLPEASGHIFGMFRQPEQRLLSLHNYAQRETERQPGSPFANPPDDIQEFFGNASGGMVFQLTHNDPDLWFCTGHSGDYTPVNDADVEEAVRVINEDFAFVGIVDQWDLSICLMHAMFGGECNAGEFEDNNPGIDLETGEIAEGSDYDVSVLDGAVDEPDRVLYEEALRIFEHNLEEFGVTAESCEQGCWATARR